MNIVSVQTTILWPVIAMVLLTFATWARLYFERIGEIRTRRISPQRIASRHQAATTLLMTRGADHLSNQFEMPVLFYVLCLSVAITGVEQGLFIVGAWAYVGIRGLHAFIHLTYNRVLHRFMAYVASSLVLLALWVAFAWRLAQL